MIEVVSAVILRKGRQLLTQRREDQDFSFHWESPGGKVEPFESHRQALLREIVEEIGVLAVFDDAPLWSGEFHSDTVREERRDVRVFRYRAKLLSTDRDPITPREGQGIGWFTADELTRIPLAPADARALAQTHRLLVESK
jgi:mutator protein MutT